MWLVIFAIILVVTCATVAAADEGLDAVRACDERTRDVPRCRSLGEQGNVIASYYLAEMYAGGKGVQKDHEEALKWYRRAAELGHLGAMLDLARMYKRGQGVPQDYQEALRWYRLASERAESDEPNTALGMMYYEGQGVPQDYQEGLKWFRIAAKKGSPAAQSNLGVMYRDGFGVPQDFVRGHMWFNVAVASWYRRFGAGSLGEANAKEARDTLGLQMTAAQIQKAQEMARRCHQSEFKECD